MLSFRSASQSFGTLLPVWIGLAVVSAALAAGMRAWTAERPLEAPPPLDALLVEALVSGALIGALLGFALRGFLGVAPWRVDGALLRYLAVQVVIALASSLIPTMATQAALSAGLPGGQAGWPVTLAAFSVWVPMWVLAVMRAADLSDALSIANGTPYALTGGLFSRSPANIERVRREFRIGNLYINRKITGALVDRQPFGGFKLSGIGSKAGGPDYLQQFLVPRTITENVLRRGFAPSPTGNPVDAPAGE